MADADEPAVTSGSRAGSDAGGVSGAARPFVDTPVGDLVAADALALTAAERWGLAAPQRLRVGMNAVYLAGEAVVRVGRPTASTSGAVELAHRLAGVGLRVPMPHHEAAVTDGSLTASCWERLDADPGAPIEWRELGGMVARLHALGDELVPAGYPCPPATSFPWWDLDAALAELGPDLDDAAASGLAAAVERHAWWRDASRSEAVVCHGDVHPGNVVQTVDGPVLLDWDLLCRAPRGWDHGPMMTWAQRWGGPVGEYEAFAAGYGWSGRGDPFAEAVAELRLVAATLMRVRAARTDPAARDEAERRLAHWRGASDAPPWRAI